MKNKTRSFSNKSVIKNPNILISLYFLNCNNSKNSNDLEIFFNFNFNIHFEIKKFDSIFQVEDTKNIENGIKNNKNCITEKKNKIGVLTKLLPICFEFLDSNIFEFNKFLEKINTIEIDIFLYNINNDELKILYLNKFLLKGNIFSQDDDYIIIDDHIVAYRFLRNYQYIFNLRICHLFDIPKIGNLLPSINIKGVLIEMNFIENFSVDEKKKENKFCFKNIALYNP